MKIRTALGVALAFGIVTLSEPKFCDAQQSSKKKIKKFVKFGTVFKKLPMADKLARTKKKKSGAIFVQDSFGTPPLLIDLPTTPLKNIFWSDGVIEDINLGTPTVNSCQEFYGGGEDGTSAGLGACYLAQNVGYSFETVLQSATTFCYMQKMSTAPAGVTVAGASSVAEALKPEADGEDKIVKAVITGFPGEDAGFTGFFIIPSRETNKSNNNLYSHKLFFCGGGIPNSVERAEIKNNLDYTLSQINKEDGGGVFASSVSSRISVDANDRIVFNPETEKEVTTSSEGGGCAFNKAEMKLKNGRIFQKSFDSCGGPEDRKAYTVVAYTGTTVSSLRFREGGFKDNFSSIVTEYRDDRYVKATNNNDFNGQLNKVDLATDEFYLEAPTIDTSEVDAFNCDRTDVAVNITMDFSNPELAQHAAPCEDKALDGMNFCRSDSQVNNAELGYFSDCLL